MFRLIRQVANRELGQWRRLADIRKLEELTDHQLADIGFRRDQLFMIESEPLAEERQRLYPAPIYRPGFEPCG